MGENVDIADPGLAGMFFEAKTAFFWAIIVSLNDGFGAEVVLLEKPSPGRTPTGSVFFGEFGLPGSISSSLC